jgi:hypothetical protein
MRRLKAGEAPCGSERSNRGRVAEPPCSADQPSPRSVLSCTNTTMLYYLSQLVQPGENLENLSEPFSIHDIDKVIKQMPTDKARP